MVLTLVSGPTDGRAVFMGFDFDASVEWTGQGFTMSLGEDGCEGRKFVSREYRLAPKWNGFGDVLVVGDAETGVIQGLKFSREVSAKADWRRWVEGVVRSFPDDCGIVLQPAEWNDGGKYYEGCTDELKAYVDVTEFVDDTGEKTAGYSFMIRIYRRDSNIAF